MIVTITARAAGDLEAIGDWIARDNPARALSFIVEIRETCFALAGSPRRYPLAPGFEDADVRRRLHGNYLIFYRADDRQVTVLRVLHGAVDYMSLLGDDI